MTTPSVARDALVTVAKSYTDSLTTDPLYASVYQVLQYSSIWPTEDFKFNEVAIFATGGSSEEQGLGSFKRFRNPRFRVDGFFDAVDHADAAIEAVRKSWIDDLNYFIQDGTPGKGYLRATGGIKRIVDMTEPRAIPLEKSQWIFRRVFEIVVETTGD